MGDRISAEGFTVRDVANYIALGYMLKLTANGWIMLKLEVIEGGAQ